MEAQPRRQKVEAGKKIKQEIWNLIVTKYDLHI